MSQVLRESEPAIRRVRIACLGEGVYMQAEVPSHRSGHPRLAKRALFGEQQLQVRLVELLTLGYTVEVQS